MPIDHFAELSGYRNTTWTLLWVGDDGTSPQLIVSEGWRSAEEAARAARDQHQWLSGFRLVAALEGRPRVYLADDARSDECGLHD